MRTAALRRDRLKPPRGVLHRRLCTLGCSPGARGRVMTLRYGASELLAPKALHLRRANGRAIVVAGRSELDAHTPGMHSQIA